MLNRVWVVFFVCALLAILIQLSMGNINVVSDAVAALFNSAKLSAEIALGLVGVLALWMGLMRVGERQV